MGKNWIDEEMEEFGKRDRQEIRKHVAYVLRNILVARTEPPRLTTIHPLIREGVLESSLVSVPSPVPATGDERG